MSKTPRLPDCAVRGADGGVTEAHASAELDRMTELALRNRRRPLRCDRPRAFRQRERRTAEALTRRWEAAGRGRARYHHLARGCGVLAAPGHAARRQRPGPVDHDGATTRMAAQMTRRLLWSTLWRPERTIASAALGTERAIELVGACNLEGPACLPQPEAPDSRRRPPELCYGLPGGQPDERDAVHPQPRHPPRREIAPGAVHVPSALAAPRQQR